MAEGIHELIENAKNGDIFARLEICTRIHVELCTDSSCPIPGCVENQQIIKTLLKNIINPQTHGMRKLIEHYNNCNDCDMCKLSQCRQLHRAIEIRKIREAATILVKLKYNT